MPRDDVASRATDPRPARTRAALLAAVERIISAPSSAVSINQIAQEAGVSRSAFYGQFANLEDLAVGMLVDTFRQIGVETATNFSEGVDLRSIGERATERVATHLFERRAFYLATLDWQVSSRVQQALVEACADQIRASMAQMAHAVPDHLDRDDFARYTAGGILTLLIAWMRDAEPVDPLTMTQRLLAVMPDWFAGR